MVLPRDTALGSLCHYVSSADPSDYQPCNITFDLLPALDEEQKRLVGRDRKARHRLLCQRALEALEAYLAVHA